LPPFSRTAASTAALPSLGLVKSIQIEHATFVMKNENHAAVVANPRTSSTKGGLFFWEKRKEKKERKK